MNKGIILQSSGHFITTSHNIMSEESGSLIKVEASDLAGLAKPTDSLINRFFDSIGIRYNAKRIVREAQAEVDAAIIREHGKIMLTDIQKRTALRWQEEEVQRQLNIEAITSKAVHFLKADAEPEKIDPDWTSSFFEKARNVRNEDMQILWAKILAGEACHPGSFSRRTLSIVSDIDKQVAHSFMELRSLCVDIAGRPVVVIPDVPANHLQWIKFDSILHLEALGLISSSSIPGYIETDLPQFTTVNYGKRRLLLRLFNRLQPDCDNNYTLESGSVIFTPFGNELAKVCSFEPVDGYFEALISFWELYTPLEDTNLQSA